VVTHGSNHERADRLWGYVLRTDLQDAWSGLARFTQQDAKIKVVGDDDVISLTCPIQYLTIRCREFPYVAPVNRI